MRRAYHFDSPMRSYIGRLYGSGVRLRIPIYCHWLGSNSWRCLLCVGMLYVFQTKEVIMSWLYARTIRSGAAWKDTLSCGAEIRVRAHRVMTVNGLLRRQLTNIHRLNVCSQATDICTVSVKLESSPVPCSDSD